MPLASDVKQALIGMDISARDRATVELAVAYATAIDTDPDLIGKFGPMLLATLEALLMTPRSRAALVKGANDDQRKTQSPLDELRSRRAARRTG